MVNLKPSETIPKHKIKHNEGLNTSARAKSDAKGHENMQCYVPITWPGNFVVVKEVSNAWRRGTRWISHAPTGVGDYSERVLHFYCRCPSHLYYRCSHISSLLSAEPTTVVSLYKQSRRDFCERFFEVIPPEERFAPNLLHYIPTYKNFLKKKAPKSKGGEEVENEGGDSATEGTIAPSETMARKTISDLPAG